MEKALDCIEDEIPPDKIPTSDKSKLAKTRDTIEQVKDEKRKDIHLSIVKGLGSTVHRQSQKFQII